MAETSYLIQPRPPVRAFVIAALLALIGAVLLVLALAQGWHVAFAVVGGVVLAAGVLLTLVAFLSIGRLAVRLTFDKSGYSVQGREAEQSGKWADVSKVTQSQDGSHVTIYHGVVRRTHLLFPAGQTPQVDKVLADVQARLKASRR